MESVIKMYGRLLLLTIKIECANRIIVYETGTYTAVVVSGWAGKCFISLNEVSRLLWLILALQSMKDEVLWYGVSTVILNWGVCFSKYDRNFRGL